MISTLYDVFIRKNVPALMGRVDTAPHFEGHIHITSIFGDKYAFLSQMHKMLKLFLL